MNKNAIIVIIAIVAIFFVYNLFSKKESISPIEEEEVDLVDPEIVDTLQKIQSIKLDPAIFSDPIFNSLKDFSREIQDEPTGKTNIFKEIDEVQEENTFEQINTTETTN